MPTNFIFGGKKITRPGVYSRIVSGRQNPPIDLDYGTVLIIGSDKHLSVNGGIRGGSGIDGTFSKGKDSIYELNNLADFQEFVGGGIGSNVGGCWRKAGEFLFRPNGSDPGVSKVYVVKPATTTPATFTFATSSVGSFKFKTRDEGLGANGFIYASIYLISGYAYRIDNSINDPNKWVFKVYRGSYTGEYIDGISYDEVDINSASNNPQLLIQSPDFLNLQELFDWAKQDRTFGSYFVFDDTSTIIGTGNVTQADVTAVAGFNVAIGGTENYTAEAYNKMLEAVKDLDYNFVITTYDDPGTLHNKTNILKIIDHITNEARFDKFLFLYDNGDFETDVYEAADLNSDRVHLVHGGIKKASRAVSSGLRVWDSFFHMCYVVGRLAGLPPQVPLTFKALGVDGLQSNLTEKQQELALKLGVIVTNFDQDRGEFVILQGINTLQNNQFTLNPDGTSFSIQIRRIAAQLNRELIINAKRSLLTDPAGVNRSTLSERDLQEWVKSYLGRKLATSTEDNLIISFRNVVVTRQEDNYVCTYEFEPNSEITKLFITGFML